MLLKAASGKEMEDWDNLQLDANILSSMVVLCYVTEMLIFMQTSVTSRVTLGGDVQYVAPVLPSEDTKDNSRHRLVNHAKCHPYALFIYLFDLFCTSSAINNKGRKVNLLFYSRYTFGMTARYYELLISSAWRQSASLGTVFKCRCTRWSRDALTVLKKDNRIWASKHQDKYCNLIGKYSHLIEQMDLWFNRE